jgi:hypothetical protein
MTHHAEALSYAGRGRPCYGRVSLSWEGNDGSGIFWRSYRCSICGIVGRQAVNVVRQQEVFVENDLVVLTKDGGGFIYPTIEELLGGINVDSVGPKVVFIIVKQCRINFEVEYGADHSFDVLQVAGGGRLGWVASTGVASC